MHVKISLLLYLLLVFALQASAQTSLVPFGSEWKYLDNGSNQGTAWRATTFSDATWKTGNGKFGYGISDATTVISYGPNAKKKYITTYFRKAITLADEAAYSSYTAKVKRDDGVVVYVNGVEVYRNNMPTGTITYTTLASGPTGGDDGATPIPFTIPATALTSGTNIIAAEVHQQRANSSDLAFDLELVGNPVNQPPTVSISSPAEGAGFTVGQTIDIAAVANDPEGALTEVEFFANSVSLGKDNTSSYSISWTPTTTGTYTLTARATDGAGAATTSAGVNVTITVAPPVDQTPPVVTSINRQNPTSDTTSATSVIFRATFSEKVTGVEAVDFTATTVSGTVTGTVTAVAAVGTTGSVYDVTVVSVSGTGILRLDLRSSGTGIADVAGNAIQAGYTNGQSYIIGQTPEPPSTTTLISFQSSWKYLDNGTNQGTGWRSTTFDDANWKTGNGKFGYGISEATTVVSYGPNASNKYITTYFRKSITIADASVYTSYIANVKRDDGVVVYVNGVEVYRNNMPTGTIAYTTLASASSGGDDGATPILFTIPATAFVSGINTIAVEIHQYSASSSDIAFDMELIGNISPPPANQPPIVSISSPANNSIYKLGQSVTITATASDQDGSLVNVEFFANGNKLGEDATSPYSFNWTPTSTSTYNLTAKTTDNAGAITTSASILVSVITVTQNITPLFVTELVQYDTDDPAIWVNKANPAESLIIGTDKNIDGALYVFNMEGKILPEKVVRNLQRPNNVDVEYGLDLQGNLVDIAVTTERYTGKLRIFTLPDMQVVDKGGIDVFVGETGTGYREPMGISLYKRPSDGKIYAIVSRKSGPRDGTYLWQYLLEEDGQGNVKGTLVRKFGNYSGRQEIEAVAVDDELGYVYYSDETVGVRKYFADPTRENLELALFATDFDSEHEGISIYKIEDGTGYILVSNQFSDEFRVFTREGTSANPHNHQLIKIVKTAANDTDGTEIANYPILPHFPNGVFVAMSSNRTFHLYRWEDIAGSDLKVQPLQFTATTKPLIQPDHQGSDNLTNQLRIYPTLAKRGAVITIKTNHYEESEVSVSDVTGRIFYNLKFTNSTFIKTMDLPAGMYIINLLGEKRLLKQKFMVTD